MTEEIYRTYGGLGARLHKAEDGTWVAYTQWLDKQTWETAQQGPAADSEARAMMQESIALRYPKLRLEVLDDLLAPRAFAG